MNQIYDIDSVRADMAVAGYAEMPPTREGDWINVRAAEESKCSLDGLYRAYVGFKSPTSYRAFAVCPNNHAEEF